MKEDDPLAATTAPPLPRASAIASSLRAEATPISGVEATMAGPRLATNDHARLVEVERAHYTFGEEIARGGMGRILRARDRRLGREVAVKELLGATPDARARFEREARITARLQHPAIVNIYEAGTFADGSPFYAMKLVAGTSFDKVIERTEPAARLGLLPIVLAIADALAYAHSRNVIHRDLKPHNILVGEFGETVVIDWGLAKDLSPDAADDSHSPSRPDQRVRPDQGETIEGSVMGTPAYMPREQAAGDPVDARADVYAIGAILYKALTGKTPYVGKTAQEILDAVLREPPVALEKIAPETPVDLRTIVARAMARDRANRYPSAGELADDLRRYQTGQLVASHEYSSWQLMRRFIRRNRRVLSVAAVLVTILVVVSVVSVREIIAERDEAETERGRANTANHRSELARADLHVQLADRELVADEPLRALAQFSEMSRLRADIGPGVRYSIGRAAAEVGHGHRWRAHDSLTFAMWDRTGRIITWAEGDAKVRVWSAAGARLGEISLASPVAEVRLTPDGSRIITVGRDLAVWDAASLANVQRVELAELEGIYASELRPDGTEIATADNSKQLALWPVGGAAPRITWAGHGSSVRVIAFNRIGTRLATASEDRTAAIWDVTDGRRIATITHEDTVHRVAFSPDGALLASSSNDGVVIISNAQTGDVRHRLKLDAQGVYALAFAADGRRLVAAAARKDVTVWDVSTGTELVSIGQDRRAMRSAAHLIAGGRELVTGSFVGELEIRGLDHGERRLAVRGSPTLITTIDRAPDGRVVIASLDGHVAAWDTTARTHLRLGHDKRARNAFFSRDGTRVVTFGDDGRVRVWSTDTGTMIREIAAGTGELYTGACTPDATRIATAEDRVVRVWDLATGAKIRELAHDEAVTTVAITIDGTRVITGSKDGVTRMWDVASGETRWATKPSETPVFRVRIDPTGALVASLVEGPTSMLLDLATGAVRRELATGHGMSSDVAFTSDGSRIAVGGINPPTQKGNGAVVLFETGSKRPGDRLKDMVDFSIASVEFSADGNRLLTGSADGPARIFELATGSAIALVGARAIARARFDKTGTLVIGVSLDANLHVWDAATGKRLSSVRSHDGELYRLELRPDGAQVATVGDDSAVRLWSVPRFTGTNAELQRLVRCRVPWQIENTELVPATPPATGCD